MDGGLKPRHHDLYVSAKAAQGDNQELIRFIGILALVNRRLLRKTRYYALAAAFAFSTRAVKASGW